ncbi:hypothetical protein [Xanthomonas oryzae]|uniref:hypothetical protein n=1 Tax=Xanthomonas oryzae TaxID=347 RepID=UPI00197D977C|nr:hypothetical protein [Xanthomonas oryzae]
MCALFRFSLQAGFALHAVTLCLFSGQPSTLCLFGCKDGFFACSDLSFASLDLGQAFGFQSGALGFLAAAFSLAMRSCSASQSVSGWRTSSRSASSVSRAFCGLRQSRHVCFLRSATRVFPASSMLSLTDHLVGLAGDSLRQQRIDVWHSDTASLRIAASKVVQLRAGEDLKRVDRFERDN